MNIKNIYSNYLFNSSYGETIKYANLAYFFHNLIFRMPVWVTFLTLYKGMDIAQISILISIRYIVSIILELPSGIIADVIGRKITVIIGYFLTMIAAFMFVISTEYWHFVFMFVIAGIYLAMISGAEEALIYDDLKQNGYEERFHDVSLIRGTLTQYAFVIAIITGGLSYLINPNLPFILETIFVGISLLLFLKTKEPSIDSEKYSLKIYVQKLIDGTREITKTSYMIYFSLFYALVGGITFSFQLLFNQALLVDLGFSILAITAIFAFNRILNITFLRKFMKTSKFFNFRNIIIYFPIVMTIGYLLGSINSMLLVLVSITLAMLASTSRNILLNKYLNENIEDSHRATAISVVNLFLSIIYSIIGIFAAYINDIRLTFLFFGIFSVLVVFPLGIKVLQLRKKYFN